MSAGKMNIKIPFATKINLTFELTKEDTGEAWPLSGLSGLFMIKSSTGTALLTCSTTNSRMTVADGVVVVNTNDLTYAEVAALLPVGVYQAGLSFADSTSGWIDYLGGTVEIYEPEARV
jgi:hypothetical protein